MLVAKVTFLRGGSLNFQKSIKMRHPITVPQENISKFSIEADIGVTVRG